MKKSQSANNMLSGTLSSTGRASNTFWLRIWQTMRIRPLDCVGILIAGVIPAFLMFLIYMSRGTFPMGDSTVLVLDLNGQYVSFYEAIFHFVRGDASLLYSFSRALGGEFLGIFDYYVASPLIWLFVLFPQSWMQEILLALFLLKTALCGMTMAFYLQRHSQHPNQVAIITFSILYALSSYAVVQQHNSMWIDTMILLPLLTYGIEELIKKARFRLFVITLALTIISNFYIGYMICIYVVVYCFFYYFAHNQNNENNPLGERAHFIRSVTRAIFWMALAIGISALTILSAKYALDLGKSNFSDPNYAIEQKFTLFDFLYKFLPSSYDTVRPKGLPFVYCGMLTLLLVPSFFMSKKVSTREKIASGLLILFFVASFAVSTLDLIWHGFQKPNWLNHRYSFILCFFLLTLAARAFDHLKHTSKKAMLGTTAIIGLYILVAQALGKDHLFLTVQENMPTATPPKFQIHPYGTFWLAIGCILAYLAIICLIAKVKRFKELFTLILTIIVCIEVFISGLNDINSLGRDVGFTTHAKYAALGETFRPIVDQVEEYDDGFYRMEKTFTRKKTDNMVLNINGLSCSTSTLNESTIKFLHKMGYASESNWTEYLGGNPVNDSLLGVKYLISNLDLRDVYGDPIFGPDDYGYDKNYSVPTNYFGNPKLSNGISKNMTTAYLTDIKDFYVYENPYALSIAFGVADSMADFDSNQVMDGSDYSTPFEYINAMITAMLGEDETVQVFVPAQQNGDPLLSNITTSQTATQLLYKTTSTDSSATLTYSYSIPTGTDVYFYYPANNDREATITVNGKHMYDPYDDTSQYKTGGDHERIINLGSYANTDLTIKLKINNKYNNLYVLKNCESYVYYIDYGVLADVMERLGQTQLVVDTDVTDDHLTGSLTTSTEDQLILTTIPYDAGWNVTVDGQKVEVVETEGALLAFRVTGAGEHRIDLRYMPNTIVLGAVISGIFLLVFLVLFASYTALRIVLFVNPALGNKFPFKSWILFCEKEVPAIPTEEDLAPIEPEDLGYEPPEEKPARSRKKPGKK